MTAFRDPPPGVTKPTIAVAGYVGSRRCKGCQSTIHWWETVAGKASPHDADGTSHFATCPVAQTFRKSQGAPRI